MDQGVKDLLSKNLRDLLSLEVTLFFHLHPELIESKEGLCHRLSNDQAALALVLHRLSQAGILERFELGGGKYEVYCYTHNVETRALIRRLSSYYHEDPISRTEIIKHIIAQSIEPKLHEPAKAVWNE